MQQMITKKKELLTQIDLGKRFSDHHADISRHECSSREVESNRNSQLEQLKS